MIARAPIVATGEGPYSSHVAQTRLFSHVGEAKIVAKTRPRCTRTHARTHVAQAKSLKLFGEELAERVGFEPTCRLPDKTLSRRPRYDHFGTSPYSRLTSRRSPKTSDSRTYDYSVRERSG
jgi:hypothetical protein